MFSINDEARNLQQNLRQCRLSTEVLDYFPVYGRWYCHVECEMARTQRLCQCLRVTHPQLPGARICDAAKLNCTKRAAVTFGSSHCTCPQTCDDHVTYYKVQTYDLNNKECLDFF
ncbi:pickpocket protein 28-like [Hyposmocoma kahamanoa]|uniref:pickpocket protein 28-like n=1 Tax=Hyposmocoma kahamanoa TaxID=1477025 RepID=UPI000E6D94C0|nr:pickpocket protein 28-like [Hyposmocoma kahamanoa]